MVCMGPEIEYWTKQAIFAHYQETETAGFAPVRDELASLDVPASAITVDSVHIGWVCRDIIHGLDVARFAKWVKDVGPVPLMFQGINVTGEEYGGAIKKLLGIAMGALHYAQPCCGAESRRRKHSKSRSCTCLASMPVRNKCCPERPTARTGRPCRCKVVTASHSCSPPCFFVDWRSKLADRLRR